MTRRKRGRLSGKQIGPEVSEPEYTTPEVRVSDSKADFHRAGTLKDIPYSELARIAEEHPEVAVTIRRRNAKGQLASLGYSGVVFTPDGVSKITDWIAEYAGGGTYAIDVTSIKDRYNRLVPSFEIVIEGLPRPPRSVMEPKIPSSFAGAPHMPYDPSQPLPGAFSPNDMPRLPGVNDQRAVPTAWLEGVHPSVRAQYLAAASGAHVQLPPGASIASDQLAMESLRRAEARAAELEAKLTAALQRSEERERVMQEQLREEREKAREREHAVQIEMLKMQMAQQTKPAVSSVQEYVPLLTALAPVLAAMVAANKDASTKSAELQHQGIQQMLNLVMTQATKPQPDPLSAIEKLAPILQMTQRDSSADVAKIEAMGNQNLQMMGMMAQMVAEFGNQQGESVHPGLLIAKQFAESLMAMAQAQQADQQRQLMQAAQQRQLGAGTPQQVIQATPTRQPTQQSPVGNPAYRTIDATPKPQSPIKLNPMMLELLPAEFKSPEWKGIIIGLHEKHSAEDLGQMIAAHIGHLDQFSVLPAVLADFHVNPPEALRNLVAPLPIYTADRAYCEAVIEQTVQAMFAQGVLTLADETAPEEADESEGDEDEATDPDETVAVGDPSEN